VKVTPSPMTVRELLARLDPFGPTTEGEELTFVADPPADLDIVLSVLHTGVRAALAGRRWVGCDGTTGRAEALNPNAPIPAGITLLCVEGDGQWDRIDPTARLDAPRLFAPAPGPSGGR